MHKHYIWLLATIVLSISSESIAFGISSTDGVLSREENSSGLFGLAKDADIKVDGASALKDVQNIVIASFKVGFVESAKQTNQAKGTFMKKGFGGKAQGNVTLQGVSAETMQSITNAAYNDFVTKLKAQGFNIVDRSTLTASSEYASMSVSTFPYEADSSGLLSEYGKTVFYQPNELGSTGVTFAGDLPVATSGTSLAKFVPGLTGIKGALGAQGDIKVANYAEKNGVALLSATYVVDFAAAGGHEGISSASIEIGQNMSVTQASLKVISSGSSTFKNGLAHIYIGQPVQSDQEFGEVINDTSDMDVVLQEAANVASLVVGQGTNRSRNYIIKADPIKYETLSVDVLTKSNSALVSKTK